MLFVLAWLAVGEGVAAGLVGRGLGVAMIVGLAVTTGEDEGVGLGVVTLGGVAVDLAGGE